MTDQLIITNEADQSEFVAVLNGQRVGVLQYRRSDDVIDLQHTIVEPAVGGRGVGSTLVKAALDHACAEGLSVIPTCTFIPPYVAKHPEYQDLLR